MPADAMHELKKAILLCPSFADLRVRLAGLYRQTGDLDAARFELEEAISAKNSYVPAHVALGVVLLALNLPEEATERWKHALGLDPENRAAAMYLRMAGGAAEASPAEASPAADGAQE